MPYLWKARAMPSRTPSRRPVSAPLPSTLLALVSLLASAGVVAQTRVVQAGDGLQFDGRPAALDALLGAGTVATGPAAGTQLRLADGSVLVLQPGSRLKLPAGSERRLRLQAGGLRLAGGSNDWTVELPDRAIRATGMLRLQWCADGCTAPPGLYGSTAAGEATLEYSGGRAVLRNRHFRWPAAALRPEVMVRQPELLAQAGRFDEASRVRTEGGAALKSAIEAFRDGDDARAEALLQQVRESLPAETLVPYYRGLIALRREDNAAALGHLQQYAREDPDGATARDVPKTLTLLSSNQLQQEVAAAVARERQSGAAAPEPNSIAVQAFVNHGDAQYRAMAKGLAAMVIADLSKVPGLSVLEREKVQLLMDEAKLGDSGLADRASAVRSGRLMRAEKVIVGNFEVQ